MWDVALLTGEYRKNRYVAILEINYFYIPHHSLPRQIFHWHSVFPPCLFVPPPCLYECANAGCSPFLKAATFHLSQKITVKHVLEREGKTFFNTSWNISTRIPFFNESRIEWVSYLKQLSLCFINAGSWAASVFAIYLNVLFLSSWSFYSQQHHSTTSIRTKL